MEKILRDKGGGGEESCGRNSHNYAWSTLLQTSVGLLGWNLGTSWSFWSQNAPILLQEIRSIFQTFFLFMSTCNEEKQVVEGPHHPFFPLLPSQPRDCSTAPASSCSAARSPLRDQYSLSLSGGNLSPNLCRLSFSSRRTSIYLTLRLESLILLITLMSWLSSGPKGFYSIHFLTIWYSQSRWDCISVSHSVNYEAQRDKNTINRNQKLI